VRFETEILVPVPQRHDIRPIHVRVQLVVQRQLPCISGTVRTQRPDRRSSGHAASGRSDRSGSAGGSATDFVLAATSNRTCRLHAGLLIIFLKWRCRPFNATSTP
jgi:hypothetical protein